MKFDAIPKGYNEDGRGGLKVFYTDERKPPGYPDPAWSELQDTANNAQDRLGIILRDLMGSTK